MHLAVPLGIKAIRHGIGVYFVTLHALVQDLRKAYAEQRLERMRVYLAPKVLIIDEVGYLPFDSVGQRCSSNWSRRGMSAGASS